MFQVVVPSGALTVSTSASRAARAASTWLSSASRDAAPAVSAAACVVATTGTGLDHLDLARHAGMDGSREGERTRRQECHRGGRAAVHQPGIQEAVAVVGDLAKVHGRPGRHRLGAPAADRPRIGRHVRGSDAEAHGLGLLRVDHEGDARALLDGDRAGEERVRRDLALAGPDLDRERIGGTCGTRERGGRHHRQTSGHHAGERHPHPVHSQTRLPGRDHPDDLPVVCRHRRSVPVPS